MGNSMAWLLLWAIGNSAAIVMESHDQVYEVSECVLDIAEQYLGSRCLAFLFPLNFNKPSVLDVPPLLRSGLLKALHKEWAPTLPAGAVHNVLAKINGIGATTYLHCSHIIALDEVEPLIEQINRIMYTFLREFYEDGGGNKTRMVLVKTTEVDEAEVYQLLLYMYNMGDVDVIFIGRKQGDLAVFSFFPFGIDGISCPERDGHLETLDYWKNSSFTLGADLFPEKLPQRFNGCIMNVSTVDIPPSVFLDSKNQPYNGAEYNIVEIMAHKMGVRTSYIGYKRADGWLWAEGKEVFGSTIDLRRGNAWLSCGGLSNVVFNFPCLHIPHTFMTMQLVWFFLDPQELPTWKLLYVGFSASLWTIVFVTLVFFAYSLYILGKLEGTKSFFRGLSSCLLISWSIAVGQSGNIQTRSNVIRLLLASWLFYTMHVNLAYTAALSGLFATGKMEPKITALEQILEQKLKTALTVYIKPQLHYIDEPVLKKVTSNYISDVDYDQVYDGMKASRNLTILAVDPYFSYWIKKGKRSMYRSNLELCFYGSGIMIRRNHFFNEKLKDMSTRVFESGLPLKLFSKYVHSGERHRVGGTLKVYNLTDLAGPFILLICGHLLAFIIFIAELYNEVLYKYMRKIVCFHN